MAQTLDPSIRGRSACAGCSGIHAATPVRVANRPGLPQVAYRVGTHGRFLTTLLARLSDKDHPGLRALATRDPADLTIAFLDACAAADDGLTFYAERYAQEWFLGTASERLSLVQLARLIGYTPRPGAAASAYLAFTVEDTPGSPESTTVELGTRVQSIPGKNELPQTFETSATTEVRALWNAMRVRTSQPQALATTMTLVVVQGLDARIQAGDSVLIVAGTGSDDCKVKRVLRAVADPATGTTRLELGPSPTPSAKTTTVVAKAAGRPQTGRTLTNGLLDALFAGTVTSGSTTQALGLLGGWSQTDFTRAVNTPKPLPPSPLGVFALRQRAAIFGHNAPRWETFPQVVADSNRLRLGRALTAELAGQTAAEQEAIKAKWQYPDSWEGLTLGQAPGPTNAIDLDTPQPTFVVGSWVVLESPNAPTTAGRVAEQQELTRTDFALTAKITRLQLEGVATLNAFKLRETTVLGQSEQLPLAAVPLAGDLGGGTITLDGYYPGLTPGRVVIVTGPRTDLFGVVGNEARTLAAVEDDGTLEEGRLFTRLTLDSPLSYRYEPTKVTINANVVLATHGETKAEALGGGDGAARYQTFTLKQQPLTYVSAQTPTGRRATLSIRVNRVLWHEAPNLYGLAPDARAYALQQEDDGRTRVVFNAPVPGGQENVQATYRVGSGLAGQVKAQTLALLTTRPLGVRSVTNPLPANGAADPERGDAIRRNSPLTVLTLDRLVSLHDYTDFARAFTGFSKALATRTVDGAHSGIHLTVAGATGAITSSDQSLTNLVGAIKALGDPTVNVVVAPYRPAFFQVQATVGLDPDSLRDDVLAALDAALRDTFGFERRDLGQDVTAVAVIAAIQCVPGVRWVDLNALFRTDPLGTDPPPTLADRLSAAQPTPGSSAQATQAAELLTLDPRPLAIGVTSV